MAIAPPDVWTKMVTEDLKNEADRLRRAVIVQSQLGVGSGTYAPPAGSKERSYSSADLTRMIDMRMRWSTNPFPFLEAHKDHTGTVHVFLVKDGASVTLADDFAMFPSDALITQIRVLVG